MKRCMIIDDSSVIRKVAKRILSGQDMAVIEAGNGGEALGMCHEEVPDTIIIDSALPDMTYVECIQRLLALDPQRKPRIVLCMPEFDLSAIMRAKRAGASDYMFKPFTRQQLMANFEQARTAA